VTWIRSCASNAGPAANSELWKKVELKGRLMRRRGGVLAGCDTNVANRFLLFSEKRDKEGNGRERKRRKVLLRSTMSEMLVFGVGSQKLEAPPRYSLGRTSSALQRVQ
jgi:hypothetical protein